MSHVDIGRRVRAALPEDVRQADVAARVGLTPDAFSRSLNAKRSFSSIELAKLAEVLQTDLHFLITGEPDPHKLTIAARHDFDGETGQRSVPGREDDDEVLSAVALAYRQAYPGPAAPLGDLPSNPNEVRRILGDDFVRAFADRVEHCLAVDVVRVPLLSTDYSFSVVGKRVVLLKAQANWFRSNWSLAHELAHHALGHHRELGVVESEELAANRFAAELLLPAAYIKGIDWVRIAPSELAREVWARGVSTESMRNRLENLRIDVSSSVRELLSTSTVALLRAHGSNLDDTPGSRGPFASPIDPIAARSSGSAGRRFPLSLQKAHIKRISAGEVSPKTLAWMLDCDVGDLPVAAPVPQSISLERLESALGQ